MSLVRDGPLQLVTFDGDVTLYDDGESLTPDNPAIPRILRLMKCGTRIGIVTAAGYTEAQKYYSRLYGLLEAIHDDGDLEESLKSNLVVMGGESNYLFRYCNTSPERLVAIPRDEWALEEMRLWRAEDIEELLTLAEKALSTCVSTMHLDAQVLRKERAVGIIPTEGRKFAREQLEETVLVTQKILVRSMDSCR